MPPLKTHSVFIFSVPRSGSTTLTNLLAQNPAFSLTGEKGKVALIRERVTVPDFPGIKTIRLWRGLDGVKRSWEKLGLTEGQVKDEMAFCADVEAKMFSIPGLLVTFDFLIARPERALDLIYEHLGMDRYPHDLERIEKVTVDEDIYPNQHQAKPWKS